jgi:DNA-binding transcriptional ArsR family regulator
MDVARPYSAVVPSLDGDVLVTLAGTSRPLTGRQVAELSRRGSQTAVSAVLDRLVEHGLVLRQQAGRAHLHTLNREHVAAGVVEGLAGLRAELLQRLRMSLSSWDPAALHASMFGSAARGDGDTASDIDLFIVRPAQISEDDAPWAAQIDELSRSTHAWTGNHAGIIDVSARELSRLFRDRPPVFEGLRSDAIHLAGMPLPMVTSIAGGNV